MLAYDYPLLGLFWTMLWIFIWVAWIFLLIRVFADIFRSHDMGGWAKALWSIFIIFLPFLGVLIYLIARGGSMQQRDIDVARQQEQAFRSYVQETAGGASTADELAKLADLRSKGVLSDAEFEAQKARLLA
jgi:ABC-type multidrug transport system fused ATPase/permease subunit